MAEPTKWWKKAWRRISDFDSAWSVLKKASPVVAWILKGGLAVIGIIWAWISDNGWPLLLFALSVGWIGLGVWSHHDKKRVVREIQTGPHTQVVHGDGSVDHKMVITEAVAVTDRVLTPGGLEIGPASTELPSGNTWILRLAVSTKGPGGLFEAELSGVEGGESAPTTEVPLLWSPDNEKLKQIDKDGPARYVLLGFAMSTATTVTDPPVEQPAFYYEPPGVRTRRRLIALVEDEMRLTVLIRNHDERHQFESAVVRVWAEGDRIEAEVAT